ncbi:MAG: LytTR family DNA-binding domain-containing protein [Chitinophagaceae bacterium]
MNIRTIIVDDEPKAIEVLERYVARIPFMSLERSFRNPSEAISFIKEQKIDLVLLDINMPNLSGIEFSKLIIPGTQIIFTTAYPEFAVHGFDINATDYLLKPVEFDRFVKAINKATDLIQTKNTITFNNEVLFFKSGTKIHKVNTEDILFFSKEGNYFFIHIRNKINILIRTNFADLFTVLPPNKFLRVHKSYIVSIKNIDIIEGDEIIIEQTRIPVGLNYKNNLDQILPK